jgi:hypothetical protein
MRCYICDFHSTDEDVLGKHMFRVDKDGKEVCMRCVKESRKYWKYQGYEGVSDLTTNVDKVIDEMFSSIPELFNEFLPTCPGSCHCKCTYKSGCKMLVDKYPK